MAKRPDQRSRRFPSAEQDSARAYPPQMTPQTESTSFRLAFADQDFLLREDLRPVRFQLELLKPELALQDQHIETTIVVFGSARVPDPETAKIACEEALAAAAAQPSDPAVKRQVAVAERVSALAEYYEQARRLAQIVSKAGQINGERQYVIVTGGGPGIMEAANRGAHDVDAASIGLNIVLPHEQAPNPYITPELCFQFHYFALRKMHFLMRAQALVAFPGGFGTMDELFETLTLIQTEKIKPIPVLLFGEAFWRRIVNFEQMAEEGVIAPEDLNIFQYVETAEDAWRIIADHHGL